MPDLMDPVDPSDPGSARPPDYEDKTRESHVWHQVCEHLFWFLSRAALLGAIAFGMIALDLPLRSLVEGDALKQLQSEKQKTILDEVQLLRETLRQVSEMTVALSTIRSAKESGTQAERIELERTRERFRNAANRFDERFSSRRSPLTSQELERLMYDIRDASRRIADHLRESAGQVNLRRLGAQADLLEQLGATLRFRAESYICKRSDKQISHDGRCT